MTAEFEKYIIVCGHYGAGKTNFSLNLARMLNRTGKRVALVDLDVVNPYFRSADYAKELEREGIRVVSSKSAGTTLDIPALSAAVQSVFTGGEDHVIFDTGGDDAGVTALGRFSAQIRAGGRYTMLYVINRYRVLTATAGEAAALLPEIESASRLRATGLVNNSHLSGQTTAETILDSVPFAAAVSDLTGLPILFTTAPPSVSEALTGRMEQVMQIQVYVKLPWET